MELRTKRAGARVAIAGISLTLLSLVAASCKNGGENKASTGAPQKSVVDKPAPTGKGVVRGVVKLDGAAPAPERWGGAENAECKSLRPENIQLVKVQDGKLEDAFVYVKDGLPQGTYPLPDKPVEFDQKGCEFTPRVFGIRAGQDMSLKNSDKFLHNVKSPEWNQAFPFGAGRTMKLEDDAVMATIKCDVHPWMRAYAGVLEHPYFAVSKSDGSFSIEGLVGGEVTLAAWHEKLGSIEQKVTIAEDKPASVELVFKPKS